MLVRCGPAVILQLLSFSFRCCLQELRGRQYGMIVSREGMVNSEKCSFFFFLNSLLVFIVVGHVANMPVVH